MSLPPRDAGPRAQRTGPEECEPHTEPAEVVVDVEVRYAETDQMGVVHHAQYPVWFEIARTRLCAASGVHYAEIERLGYHLMVSRVEVGYAQAVLGAEIDVETLRGAEKLVVPPGTRPGQLFKLKGRGIDRLGGSGRGDHLVEIDLRIPRPSELGEEARALLARLAELEGEEVRGERGVLERVKELFGG